MTWFKNLRISAKLIGAFSAILLLTTVMGVVSVQSLSALNHNTSELATNWLVSVEWLAGMRYTVMQHRLHEINHILAAPEDKARFDEASAKAVAGIAKLEARYVPTITPGERADYALFKDAWAKTQEAERKLVVLSRAGKRDQALTLFMGDSLKYKNETVDALTRLIKINAAGGDNEALAATASYEHGRTFIGAMIAICLGLGIALALGIARMIGGPVRQIAGIAARVALGDVDQAVEHQSKDEVGQLADSFRALIGYIKGVASHCERLGQGDLQIVVEPRSDKDVLSKSFQTAVDSLRQTVTRMSESSVSLSGAAVELGSVSRQMGTNAEETSNQANVVAAAAAQVSKTVQTVASSTEEMSASIKEVAKNAAEAAKVAATAVRVTERTNAIVTKLGLSSAEIGNVIKVITSIAAQTNLLALNATIEAARAGEAGKGFAVVANEVKELAKETAKATEDIGRKIAAIQTDTKEAVEAIGEIGQTIGQVNDIQNTIAGAVEEQAATTNEIGRNVTEAARASSEIAQNISGVAQAAQSTSSGAAQCQGAASELAKMSIEMQALVGNFTTGEATGQTTQTKTTAHVPAGSAANENSRARRAKLAAV
jgi:methyl-accepting chemotaxis protein